MHGCHCFGIWKTLRVHEVLVECDQAGADDDVATSDCKSLSDQLHLPHAEHSDHDPKELAVRSLPQSSHNFFVGKRDPRRMPQRKMPLEHLRLRHEGWYLKKQNWRKEK